MKLAESCRERDVLWEGGMGSGKRGKREGCFTVETFFYKKKGRFLWNSKFLTEVTTFLSYHPEFCAFLHLPSEVVYDILVNRKRDISQGKMQFRKKIISFLSKRYLHTRRLVYRIEW